MPTKNTTHSFVPHAAVYTRISSDRDGHAVGVGRQEKDARAVISHRWPDLPIVVYQDNDRSAYTGRKRPEFDRMMEAVDRGEVVAIAAYNLDRFLRRPVELESVIERFERVRLTRFATAQADLDLTTHDGQLTARILVAVAKKASDDTSRRVKRSHADKLARGERIGRMPYGVISWEGSNMVVDEHARDLLIDAVGRVLTGEPMRRVWQDARTRDPRVPQSIVGWRNLLLRSPILSAVQRAQINAFLSDPARKNRGASDNTRAHWLAGILRCSVCGAAMRRTYHNRDDRHLWTCPTPPNRAKGTTGHHVTVGARNVEHAVSTALFESAAVEVVEAPALPEAVDEGTEARLEELAVMYAAGELPRAAFNAAMEKVKAAVPPPPAFIPSPVVDLAAVWDTLDVHQRHAAALALVDQVQVQPVATRGRQSFDPDRLSFGWRHADNAAVR